MHNNKGATPNTTRDAITYLCIMASAFGLLAVVGIAYFTRTEPVQLIRTAKVEISHCTIEGAIAVKGQRGSWNCYAPK
ncbi:hypothetical protein [Pseudovibrio sp. Tun.PSC04-5.I4]|uniref:hypothetical protein n=1 Tax=Pseudovibrio sp. Tun.PSC04-5.I4 TaxID=1798213 RepID=UPI000882C9B8|nr:hypothetical protein [Pseudovibrio sp. Tun.PSC04-5.I4]SDR48192.1 hypothetical protein SAMN04515695_5935 [Pseudovibrio sp. Tun.PSC04-5.I4]